MNTPLFKEGENNMNKLYKEILLNLMLIENEVDPIVRMLAYAKIAGIVEYAFAKDDIEEEKAKEFSHILIQLIYSCIDQLNS